MNQLEKPHELCAVKVDLCCMLLFLLGVQSWQKKLYVGNLSHDITDNELQDIFESHGSVLSAQVIVDRENTSFKRGFGFVEMSSEEEAQNSYRCF